AFIIHVRASLFSLFFLLSRSPHDLHSFPTRRSSDLLVDHHATGRVHTLDVKATDLAGIVNAAREIQADLVVVGPEDPLCMGLARSEEHTSELQSRENLVCRLLLEKKKYGK